MKKKVFTPMQILASIAIISLTVMLSGCGDDDDNGPKVTSIDIKSMSPNSPATLKYYQTAENDRITIIYDYTVVEPDGARIWIKPHSTTSPSYDFFYTGSSVLKGTGSRAVIVSIESDEPSVIVDELEIKIVNHDHSKVISESTVDVNFTFKE